MGNGKMMRLAFVKGKVVEAKNMETGDTHTPKEFANDAKRKAKKAMKPLKRGKKLTKGKSKR